MTKMPEYHRWEEDDYDPYAYSISDVTSRRKKRRNASQADFKKQGYEDEEEVF